MNRTFVLVALALALILGVGAIGSAQDATPGAGTLPGDLCASPVGSPEATPVEVVLATPGVDPGASPEASPETLFVCASPVGGTPETGTPAP